MYAKRKREDETKSKTLNIDKLTSAHNHHPIQTFGYYNKKETKH